MSNSDQQWLDAVLESLAEARAALLCFDVRNAALEACLDAALREAQALKARLDRP